MNDMISVPERTTGTSPTPTPVEPEAKGHLTIRDIARMTGFSRSTVSLAINDDPRINAETKTAIMGTIKRVGYKPNAAAQAIGARNGKASATRKATQKKAYKVSQAKLRSYVGNYTEREITYKQGYLHYYHHYYKTEHRLLPISLDTFAVESLNWFQIRFVCDEDDRPIKIIGMYLDREPDESLRDK